MNLEEFHSKSDVFIEKIYKIDKEKYIKLTKGEKEMTKSDLKDGMVVEYRNGEKRLVLNDKLMGQDFSNTFEQYAENLTSNNGSYYDIVKIYSSRANIIKFLFEKQFLNLIWTRKEKSDAEIKLEQMENQIRELQKSAEDLKKELGGN